MPTSDLPNTLQTSFRHLPDAFQTPSDTFQTPSRHRPDTFLTFSRQSSVNLQTPSIHPQGTQASEWSKKIYMVRWAAGAAATYIGAAATYMLELQPHILELQPHIWLKVIIRLTSAKVEVEVEAELGNFASK